MIVLPDVNVLVYALHSLAPRHDEYRLWLHELVNGPDDIGIVPAVLVGVVRVATNPRAFDPPATRSVAIDFVESLRSAPGARELAPGQSVWDTFGDLVRQDGQAKGNLVSDAWLAANAIAHGTSLATADRGMARWPGLDWFDPLDV